MSKTHYVLAEYKQYKAGTTFETDPLHRFLITNPVTLASSWTEDQDEATQYTEAEAERLADYEGLVLIAGCKVNGMIPPYVTVIT